jgi:cobalt-zinc-cadmium efflux system protein
LANALCWWRFPARWAGKRSGVFSAPPESRLPVIIVAAIGIAVNLGAAWFVRDGHDHDLNRRGAFLHLVADAAVSLAAVFAGTGMLWLGWEWLDPVTALLIGAVVALGAFRAAAREFQRRDDAVPRGIDQAEVQAYLASQPGVAPCITCTSGRWARARSHDRAPGAAR